MSSDSEDENPKPKYVPFAEREGWGDIKPIPQDDGPDPVCRIAYTDQFSEIMGFFRAILQKDERSPRALALTEEVISVNPANYTAWYFRRILLDELHSDLRSELAFVSKIGKSSAKNYQVWHHRKVVIEKLKDPSAELNYTSDLINDDSKNYHTWAHRQWVIQTFNLWDKELDYVDFLLKSDLRNNSAWNQRYFVVTKNRTQPITKEVRDAEIDYAFSWIKKAPNNQSPWTYVSGLFINEKFASNPHLKTKCLEFKSHHVTSPHVVSLLIDIYQQDDTDESIKQAIEWCTQLETSLDTIHKKYWVYKRNLLQAWKPQASSNK